MSINIHQNENPDEPKFKLWPKYEELRETEHVTLTGNSFQELYTKWLTEVANKPYQEASSPSNMISDNLPNNAFVPNHPEVTNAQEVLDLIYDTLYKTNLGNRLYDIKGTGLDYSMGRELATGQIDFASLYDTLRNVDFKAPTGPGTSSEALPTSGAPMSFTVDGIKQFEANLNNYYASVGVPPLTPQEMANFEALSTLDPTLAFNTFTGTLATAHANRSNPNLNLHYNVPEFGISSVDTPSDAGVAKFTAASIGAAADRIDSFMQQNLGISLEPLDRQKLIDAANVVDPVAAIDQVLRDLSQKYDTISNGTKSNFEVQGTYVPSVTDTQSLTQVDINSAAGMKALQSAINDTLAVHDFPALTPAEIAQLDAIVGQPAATVAASLKAVVDAIATARTVDQNILDENVAGFDVAKQSITVEANQISIDAAGLQQVAQKIDVFLRANGFQGLSAQEVSDLTQGVLASATPVDELKTVLNRISQTQDLQGKDFQGLADTNGFIITPGAIVTQTMTEDIPQVDVSAAGVQKLVDGMNVALNNFALPALSPAEINQLNSLIGADPRLAPAQLDQLLRDVAASRSPDLVLSKTGLDNTTQAVAGPSQPLNQTAASLGTVADSVDQFLQQNGGGALSQQERQSILAVANSAATTAKPDLTRALSDIALAHNQNGVALDSAIQGFDSRLEAIVNPIIATFTPEELKVKDFQDRSLNDSSLIAVQMSLPDVAAFRQQYGNSIIDEVDVPDNSAPGSSQRFFLVRRNDIIQSVNSNQARWNLPGGVVTTPEFTSTTGNRVQYDVATSINDFFASPTPPPLLDPAFAGQVQDADKNRVSGYLNGNASWSDPKANISFDSGVPPHYTYVTIDGVRQRNPYSQPTQLYFKNIQGVADFEPSDPEYSNNVLRARAVTTPGQVDLSLNKTVVNPGQVTATYNKQVQLPDQIGLGDIDLTSTTDVIAPGLLDLTYTKAPGENINLNLNRQSVNPNAAYSLFGNKTINIPGQPGSISFDRLRYRAHEGYTPIALDLNGDGVKTSADKWLFDLTGMGTPVEHNGALSKQDGWLAFDANGNGLAGENGAELFGNGTKVDGQTFANGFEALKALASSILGPDTVKSDKLDLSALRDLEDKIGLRVQVDGVDHKLSELGIESLNLSYSEYALGANLDENGVDHRVAGSFTRNGVVGDMIDLFYTK